MKINTTYFIPKERHIYGSPRVGVRNSDLDVLPLPDKDFSMKSVHYSIGSRTYELSNPLPSVQPSAVGNVLSVISDKVIPVFPYSNVISEMRADIRVAQDYSPFGVTLDKRNFVVSEGYRYGFNGMESDDEIKGSGNSYDFGARMHDPRIGRFLSIDPLFAVYLDWSPYVFAGNNPIVFIDDNGEGPRYPEIADLFEAQLKKNDKYVSYTRVNTSNGVEFKITAKVLGKTLYTTYKLNEKTDDYESNFDLTAWGANFYEAAIATSNSWTQRVYYQVQSLDRWVSESPWHGLIATATFIGTIATGGALATLSKTPIAKWGMAEFGTLISGVFAVDDLSKYLTGENKTALETLGVDENGLKLIKNAKTAIDGVINLKNLVELKKANSIGTKLEKTLEGVISALENTQNVLEWFQENESKNNKKTVKNGVKKT